MCFCAVVETLPDSVVLVRNIRIGYDCLAHYSFIGSSGHGDLTVVTIRRGRSAIKSLLRPTAVEHTHCDVNIYGDICQDEQI